MYSRIWCNHARDQPIGSCHVSSLHPLVSTSCSPQYKTTNHHHPKKIKHTSKSPSSSSSLSPKTQRSCCYHYSSNSSVN
ncbi:hypothetical protein L1987_23150 [Smallanthus sonchifolius]|uniref:Uncharacterized protein n=1 Tax=Smallanthus sonchifolius TaxID=185202 RepID=A0ACB9IGU5_9ASTR|nr:hypothetical protein L1987_23150 [Smallanthus sonchifolius]